MSIGMTRKKAVSEFQVIRDSDSSEKGIIIHIAICSAF